MKIKVLLFESGEEWVKIFRSYIGKSKRAELVNCVSSRTEAIHYLSKNTVDIIVLDLDLEKEATIKGIKNVSDAKIIVIGSGDLIQKDVFAMGISGYLDKNQLDICRIIEAVYDGTYTYEILFNEYNKYKIMSELSILTNAERAILKYLLGTETISEISAVNHVAESTVKKQINSIYRKLNIRRNGGLQREKLKEQYLSALKFL